MKRLSSSPSAEEFTGFYNIPDECPEIGIPVLRTTSAIPELSFSEVQAVRENAIRWFNYNLASGPNSQLDPLDDKLFVRDNSSDRTIYVDLPDFDLLSKRLLDQLQREFLASHLLWRVAIVGEDPATTVMVYPQGVRVGNRSEENDIDLGLIELAARQAKLRQARLKPRLKQIEYL